MPRLEAVREALLWYAKIRNFGSPIFSKLWEPHVFGILGALKFGIMGVHLLIWPQIFPCTCFNCGLFLQMLAINCYVYIQFHLFSLRILAGLKRFILKCNNLIPFLCFVAWRCVYIGHKRKDSNKNWQLTTARSFEVREKENASCN